MNLNYNPSTEELNALIAIAQQTPTHNLVIDFDGEVVIDPEMQYPAVPLDSYKFSTRILDASLRNTDTAEALYAALYVVYDSLEESVSRTIEVYEDERIAA